MSRSVPFISPAVAQPGRRHDTLYHTGLLVVLTTVLGGYLIAGTVVIADDGVEYLAQAQRLIDPSSGPMNRNFLGYPWLIAWTWHLMGPVGVEPHGPAAIYAAQAVTLLCRILTVLTLYSLGGMLVGPRDALLGAIVLIALPEPAHWGSDVLRDWPTLLAISLGLLAMVRGIRTECIRWFGLAGLVSGLGCFVHLFAAQTVVVATAWLGWCLIGPEAAPGRSRKRATLAMALLWAAFAVALWVVAAWQGFILPERFDVLESVPFTSSLSAGHGPSLQTASWPMGSVIDIGGRAIAGLAATAEALAENLMWFFTVPVLMAWIGLARSGQRHVERFVIAGVLLINIGLCLARYVMVDPHVSRRYVLTATALACLYVPQGLRTLASRLARRQPPTASSSDPSRKTPDGRVFWILLAAGVLICTPKLLRPIRTHKQAYRNAAHWIAVNTPKTSVIAVPDLRITLYADRRAVTYFPDPQSGDLLVHRPGDPVGRDLAHLPPDVDYVVQEIRPDRPAPDFDVPLVRVASFAMGADQNTSIIISRVNR